MRKLCHKVLSRTGQIKHTFDKHWQYFCSSTDGCFFKKKYYYYKLCESSHWIVPVFNIMQAALIGQMDHMLEASQLNKDNSYFRTFYLKIGYLQQVNLKCAVSKSLLERLLQQQEEHERVTKPENICVGNIHRTLFHFTSNTYISLMTNYSQHKPFCQTKHLHMNCTGQQMPLVSPSLNFFMSRCNL